MKLLLLLPGCAAIAERRAAADDAKCQSYGATPGTPEYTQCRMQLDSQREDAAIALAPP
jgi:hypothetical protein